ncbi:acyl-coenzyme A thioesterase PaaI-like protein [Sulfitobacter undariae]|uniref:Acyl-coenzyme A thioesterase PaaI-like protein n=1 Tax=Sulfitobacter undariae TaxID=1563671 RepID=A0A7W6E5C9_9RHOB|nr:PaaI family thioesterase [Sulfitobacter undariae]MBB3995020.1 acyl-coenzyme A thioesterase PaaI-like protein [Sulfitobacter undariae]
MSSLPSDPKLVKRLTALMGMMPFGAALGVEVIAAADGTVTLEAPLTPPFEAPPGCFAASSVGALGDMAAMLSVTTKLPLTDAMSTMDFTIKMLGNSQGARLRAVGQAKQVGKNTCVGAADIFVQQNGEWIACGTLIATGRRTTLG